MQINTPTGTWYNISTLGNSGYDQWRFDAADGSQKFIQLPDGITPVDAQANNSAVAANYLTQTDVYAEWAAQNPDKALNNALVNTEWTDSGNRVNGQTVWERVFNGVIQTFTSESKPQPVSISDDANSTLIPTGYAAGNNVTTGGQDAPLISPHSQYKMHLEIRQFGLFAAGAARLFATINNAVDGTTGWHIDAVDVQDAYIDVYLTEMGSIPAVLVVALIIAALIVLGIWVTSWTVTRLSDNNLVDHQITAKEGLIKVLTDSGMSAADAAAVANGTYGDISPPATSGDNFLGIPTKDLKYALIGLFAIVALGSISSIGSRK